jgi:hypothetical protein
VPLLPHPSFYAKILGGFFVNQDASAGTSREDFKNSKSILSYAQGNFNLRKLNGCFNFLAHLIVSWVSIMFRMFLGSKNTSWSLLMISVSRSYKAFAKILSVAFNKVIEFP